MKHDWLRLETIDMQDACITGCQWCQRCGAIQHPSDAEPTLPNLVRFDCENPHDHRDD
jgi:hypothetical protein